MLQQRKLRGGVGVRVRAFAVLFRVFASGFPLFNL